MNGRSGKSIRGGSSSICGSMAFTRCRSVAYFRTVKSYGRMDRKPTNTDIAVSLLFDCTCATYRFMIVALVEREKTRRVQRVPPVQHINVPLLCYDH